MVREDEVARYLLAVEKAGLPPDEIPSDADADWFEGAHEALRRRLAEQTARAEQWPVWRRWHEQSAVYSTPTRALELACRTCGVKGTEDAFESPVCIKCGAPPGLAWCLTTPQGRTWIAHDEVERALATEGTLQPWLEAMAQFEMTDQQVPAQPDEAWYARVQAQIDAEIGRREEAHLTVVRDCLDRANALAMPDRSLSLACRACGSPIDRAHCTAAVCQICGTDAIAWRLESFGTVWWLSLEEATKQLECEDKVVTYVKAAITAGIPPDEVPRRPVDEWYTRQQARISAVRPAMAALLSAEATAHTDPIPSSTPRASAPPSPGPEVTETRTSESSSVPSKRPSSAPDSATTTAAEPDMPTVPEAAPLAPAESDEAASSSKSRRGWFVGLLTVLGCAIVVYVPKPADFLHLPASKLDETVEPRTKAPKSALPEPPKKKRVGKLAPSIAKNSILGPIQKPDLDFLFNQVGRARRTPDEKDRTKWLKLRLGLGYEAATVDAHLRPQDITAMRIRRQQLLATTRKKDTAGATPMGRAGPPQCAEGMRRVQATPVSDAYCIDAFESPGKGRLPATRVTFDLAVSLCRKQEKRLCTGREWTFACQNGRGYPYGSTFDDDACNTKQVNDNGGRIVKGGHFEKCKSRVGAYDLSGNVAEWTVDKSIRGGSVRHRGLNASCGARIRSSRQISAMMPVVGFRCCSDLVAP